MLIVCFLLDMQCTDIATFSAVCFCALRDAGDIIPSMFQFLILLSYGRHNVKAIVTVPEIIQLCDGIMASGEMALSHGKVLCNVCSH